MVKELVVYPDERIQVTSADVRTFDSELYDVMQNMRDTMDANGMNEIAAIQIAIPATVVILKEGETYLELINPRIIASEGKVRGMEKSAYFPDLEVEIVRYDRIKLVYQDREGKPKSMDTQGELSRRIQRKIDLTFGGTLIDKLDKTARKKAEGALDVGWGSHVGESCPTIFKRDYIAQFIRTLTFLFLVSLLIPFFTDSADTLHSLYGYHKAGYGVISALIVVYFFYAQYETRQYASCTSCQTGNIIGSAIIAFIKISFLFAVSSLWIGS
jgi:peptide deformylase